MRGKQTLFEIVVLRHTLGWLPKLDKLILYLTSFMCLSWFFLLNEPSIKCLIFLEPDSCFYYGKEIDCFSFLTYMHSIYLYNRFSFVRLSFSMWQDFLFVLTTNHTLRIEIFLSHPNIIWSCYIPLKISREYISS